MMFQNQIQKPVLAVKALPARVLFITIVAKVQRQVAANRSK
jgi:hypothetical protein